MSKRGNLSRGRCYMYLFQSAHRIFVTLHKHVGGVPTLNIIHVSISDSGEWDELVTGV